MDFLIPPWEHQKKAIAFSLTQRDMALLWDVGTGKSGATINILRAKYAQYGRVMRTLILAPPVVLKNWQKEFAMHSRVPSHKVVVIQGTGAKRLAQLRAEAQGDKVLLLNYEALVSKELFSIMEGWAPEILVADEAHRCKNFQAKRAALTAKIADKTLHNYILTGTPVLNSAMDLYMQFRILDRGETFGTNFYAFRGMFFEDENARWAHKPGHFPKWVPRASTYELFNKRIYKKSLRAIKSECLDLPPLVKTIREVELNDAQKKAYKEMRDDFITFVKAAEASEKPRAVVAQLAVTKALRLQQIVSGFAKDENEDIVSFGTPPRLAVLGELLEELCGQGHKVIVWAVFKENYRQIRELCAGLKLETAELHGEISTKEKERNIERFQKDPSCKVMIGNQSAGGIGVNLVEASYMIYYSKGFSLEQDIQSEGRNYRGGSEMHDKITRIDLVTPNTIDLLVNEALRQKKNIGESILDIAKEL